MKLGAMLFALLLLIVAVTAHADEPKRIARWSGFWTAFGFSGGEVPTKLKANPFLVGPWKCVATILTSPWQTSTGIFKVQELGKLKCSLVSSGREYQWASPLLICGDLATGPWANYDQTSLELSSEIPGVAWPASDPKGATIRFYCNTLEFRPPQ